MDDFEILITGNIFVVDLWSTIFAFLYGFLKRLDKIILLLEREARETTTDERG